jgi:hypothetical protein
MPVESNHQDYQDNIPLWQKCRDVTGGEEAVKAAAESYLPRLTEQTDPEYTAYKTRALFYGATGRTVTGLTGAILRKPPKITKLTEEETDLLRTIGCCNESIDEIIKTVVTEVLSLGRYGLLVDASEGEDSDPYISCYFAENIVNWREEEIDGRLKLTLVVLKEMEEDYTKKKVGNEDYDEFCPQKIEQRRVLRLVEGDDGGYEYQVEIWQKKENARKKLAGRKGVASEEWVQIGDTITPKMKGGKSLEFIPFQFVTPLGTGSLVEKSPILDLVNVNLSHYRTSADLEHGRHFTALPTAWVAGFDPATTKLKIGSQIAWVSKDASAHAGYLEFSGSGLGSLSNALAEKQTLMAILGSRLLEEQKVGIEAAETVRLRQAGEGSVLSSIANSTSEAMENVIEWVLLWMGKSDADIAVELNKDFGPAVMDPALIQSLMAAYQAGMISFDTWFYNLKNGEIVPDDTDLDTEKSKIEMGGPKLKPPEGGGDPIAELLKAAAGGKPVVEEKVEAEA